MRLAEYYERFLARIDLQLIGGNLEFVIGRLEPMDKCQTDVWRLLQPRFKRTSSYAWELPLNAVGGSLAFPVRKGPLPRLWITQLEPVPGYV